MPGSTSVTIQNELFSTASFNALNKAPIKSLRDVQTFVAQDMLTIGAETVEGGHRFEGSYSFEEHVFAPTELAYNDPYKAFTTTSQTQMKPFFEDWMANVCPIFISGLEKNHNRGSGKKVDLAAHRTLTTRNAWMRWLEQAFTLGATATGSYTPSAGARAFSGLNTANGVDFSTGFFEEGANNTIHGIARASYPAATYPLLHPILMDFQNSVSAYVIDQIVRARLTAKRRGIDLASKSFRRYGSDDFIAHFQKVFRNAVQTVKVADGETALTEIPVLMGGEVLPVTLPSAGAVSVTYPVSFLAITWGAEGVSLTMQSGWDMAMTKWMDMPGSVECSVAAFKFEGQTLLKEPAKHVVGIRGNTF